MAYPLSLADYLRAAQIDNFSIEGNAIRIGAQRWMAQPCDCASPDCDGWAVRRLEGQSNSHPDSPV